MHWLHWLSHALSHALSDALVESCTGVSLFALVMKQHRAVFETDMLCQKDVGPHSTDQSHL